jgi:flagellum-specific ATP synthase
LTASAPALSAIAPHELRAALGLRVDGKVTRVVGLLVEGTCPGAAVGDMVRIGETPGVLAEVVGLREGRVSMIALGDLRGIRGGSRVRHEGHAAAIPCGDGLLGRVIDARGLPLDEDAGPIAGPFVHRPLYADPPPPLQRAAIDQPLHLGIRAIDGLLTLGRGQRIGIMAGAGVGKSSLLAMIARSAAADVFVLALIGERGREVVEFLEHVLTPQARRRTVVVAVTSDRSPLERMRGAFVATAVAEHFAAGGKDVVLMMDSLTRFAMAQREIGLSLGEPPATRGYTPSVFALLPRLLERAGRRRDAGSITGIYTVLVEGDDPNDPVGDAARSILDGHVVLSRQLAGRGHFPAIDVLPSISRVADRVLQPAHADLARQLRALIATIRDAEELQQMGALVPGADAALDRALQRRKDVDGFLRQSVGESTPFPESLRRIAQLVNGT